MRIVRDTNIVFSAILNTQGKLSRIILQPKSRLNLYTTSFLYQELSKHKAKLISISKYSEIEFQRAFDLITQKIKIINFDLIPKKYYEIAYKLTSDIDENDIEFVALAEHIKAKLWTSDHALIKGLKKKNWNRIITTKELYQLSIKERKRK
jgi:predicted nucleic acid-binding protein